jgi:hypothetical protein
MKLKSRPRSRGKETSEKVKKGWWNRFLERLARANQESLGSGCLR